MKIIIIINYHGKRRSKELKVKLPISATIEIRKTEDYRKNYYK